MSVLRLCKNLLCSRPFYVKPSQVRSGRGNYCCYACWRPKVPLWERVQAQIAICAHGTDCPYCCHEWQGYRTDLGYGWVFIQKHERTQYTHHRGTVPVQRVAWEMLNKQPWPADMKGLHHCDNPPCCNGMHIYPGTQQQNIEDAKQRGRTQWPHIPHRRGEKVNTAKLRESDIALIWQLHARGFTGVAIAHQLNIVGKGAIQAVLRYQTWAHISRSINAGQSEAF